MHIHRYTGTIGGSTTSCLLHYYAISQAKLIYGCRVQLTVHILLFLNVIAVNITLFSSRVRMSVQLIMAKILKCVLSILMISVCVHAEPGQRCATIQCAAVVCSYGEEPFRPPGKCCLRCRPAKPKYVMLLQYTFTPNAYIFIC